MPNKLTIDEVLRRYADKNWQLLEKEYKGARENMKCICPNGHKTQISLNNLQKGQGCAKCSGQYQMTYEEVIELFEKNNCKIISSKEHYHSYKGTNNWVYYTCECGNDSKVSLHQFKKGTRCIRCKGEKISKLLTKELPIDKIKETCKDRGCELIEAYRKRTEASGIRIRIKYKCECGNIADVLWSNFKKNKDQLCWECGKKKKAGDNCYMWNPDRNLVEQNKRSYNLVNRLFKKFNLDKNETKSSILGYNVDDLHKAIYNHPLMNEGDFEIDHVFPINQFSLNNIDDMKLINHLNNLRPLHKSLNCNRVKVLPDYCFNSWDTNISAEHHIISCIEKDFYTTITSEKIDAYLIGPKECTEIHYLSKRLKQCLEQNKKPFYLHYGEWVKFKDKLISRYNSIIGENNKRYFGRKGEIKRITSQICKDFTNEYHIQGHSGVTKSALGMYFDNELIGLVSLGGHPRDNSKLIIDRLCFKTNCYVIGGSERLFKAIEKEAMDLSCDTLITYSDSRVTCGEVYERLGYNPTQLRPDYSYVLKTDYSLHRSKQSQKKGNVNCPINMTELEWCNLRGLVRIYDAGKIRWEKELN